MPYGSGPLIQRALVRGAPWQRSLLGLAMVAAGVALVLLGHVGGGLLAAAGVLVLWRMVRHRLDRRQGTAPEGVDP